MANGALKLSQHPADVVRLVCTKCERRGRYRRAMLIVRFGRDISLASLLRLIAADCPKMQARKRNDRCGAHYFELGVPLK